MLLYFLQSSVCLALLYGFYWFFLRRNTFYAANRWVLLTMLLLSCLIPLVKLPVEAVAMDLSLPFAPLENWTVNGSNTPGEVIAESGGSGQQTPTEFSRSALLALIYILVSAGLLLRLVLELLSLVRLIFRGKRENHGAYTLVNVPGATAPLAFFRWIVVNRNLHTPPQFAHILAHEQVHVRQWHTLDILLSEVFTALFWFHPLAWALKRSLKLNLEFLADQAVLQTGADQKAYQYDLLKISVSKSKLLTANHFNYSHLKTRIAMMNRKQSSRLSVLKYFLFLPILGFLILAFQPLNAQRQHAIDNLKIKPDQNIYLKITGDDNEEAVNQYVSKLEEVGVVCKGSKFEFNDRGQLIKARLQVKIGDQFNGSISSSNDGQPIKDPIIFYLVQTEGEKFGVSLGIPSDLPKDEQKLFRHLSGLLIGTFNAD